MFVPCYKHTTWLTNERNFASFGFLKVACYWKNCYFKEKDFINSRSRTGQSKRAEPSSDVWRSRLNKKPFLPFAAQIIFGGSLVLEFVTFVWRVGTQTFECEFQPWCVPATNKVFIVEEYFLWQRNMVKLALTLCNQPRLNLFCQPSWDWRQIVLRQEKHFTVFLWPLW